jgi:hypothetical protein
MIIIAIHGRGIWVMDANPVNEKDKRRNYHYYNEPEEQYSGLCMVSSPAANIFQFSH